MKPPIADKQPYYHQLHGETRIDNYAWLRDDQRQDPKVLAHLTQENRWCERQMQPLTPLIEELTQELLARSPGEESGVPFTRHGIDYQVRFKEGDEYASWFHKPTEESEWQLLIDCNG